MIDALGGFLDVLRACDVRVSPGEAIDAARALELGGIESRETVRAALALTCAKTREERARFEDAFERYFAGPARRTGKAPGGGGGAAGAGGAGGGPAGLGAGAASSTSPRDRSQEQEQQQAGERGRLADPGRLSPSARPATSSRPPQQARGRDAIRPAPRATAPQRPPTTLARELREQARRREGRLRTVLVARAERPQDARRPRAGAAGPVTPAERRPREAMSPRGGAPAREREPTGELERTRELWTRDLRAPAGADVDRRLLEEAARILAAFRLKRGRRLEPGRSGRLAAKRTFRASLATDGVPFRILRARRRPKRPRVVLLMDVSHSVTRAAALFLRLAAGLLEEVARTTVLAFVDRPVDATEALLAWARGGRPAGLGSPAVTTRTATAIAASRTAVPTFADALERLPGIDPRGASDYGRTFYALLDERALAKRSDLVLVVLGDGRTNRFDRLEWAFADLASRARHVVWIVPERAATWGTADSALGVYLPHADLAIEGADLAGLVRGLRMLLRTVGT